MKGRALVLVLVTAAGAGGTWAAGHGLEPAGAAVASSGRMVLPATGVASVPLCPGPETLVVPAGGSRTGQPGPVAVGAVLEGRDGLLGDRPLAAGDGGAGVLTVPRTSAGPVALQPARTVAAPSPADGAAAMSLVQVSLGRSGDLRGLAAMECSTASTQAWLVGGGTQVGRRGRLLLANPAATPATVDVAVHGPDGVAHTPAGEGVVVPARGEVALLVDALAPDLAAVAVHVQARSGRVAAVLHDAWVRGTVPGGVDDVTAAAPASRSQLVPGVSVPSSPVDRAEDPGAVAVRVVNPGTDPAVARVHLLGTSGEEELEHAVVAVAPGAVADVPVTGVPAGTYTAVVDADVPVVAGALVGRRVALPGGSGAAGSGTAGSGTAGSGTAVGVPSDFGWAPSVEPLTAPALLALPTITEAGRRTSLTASLSVTAPAAGTTVEVVELDAHGGTARTDTVTVPPGATAQQDLGTDVAAVRLRPLGAAPVVAAVGLQVHDDAGPMVAVLPVRPGPAGAGARPQVVADVRVGLRG